MTNIIAAIVVGVVTNVVEVDNAQGCFSCTVNPHFVPAVMGHTPCEKYIAPTEKTKTVTVTEITTLKFNWHGKEWKAKVEKVLSETVSKWTKKEEWVKE